MARTLAITILLFTSILLFSISNLEAQNKEYEIIPAPDLWYNSVDGIRVGVRFKGQVVGSFEDGPHRLNGGVWAGLWFPDLPVSYYLRYTEPISAWSDFGSEANIQAVSSIRTGFHRHGLSLNKRWQEGFDERRYREISLLSEYRKRFDDDYVQFRALWSDQPHWVIGTSSALQNDNRFGWYTLTTSTLAQISDNPFTIAQLTATQQVPLNANWSFSFRTFLGIASEQTAPEYLFSRSSGPAIEWMQNGFTRAKGTVPQPWLRSGNFQVAGGANLRGYNKFDVDSFTDGAVSPFLLNSIGAFNAEFYYPNPLGNLLARVPYLSDFLTLRSYLFYDVGTSLGVTSNDTDTIFADAGTGFSLNFNIPDAMGKPRGFVFRYDIPFWLSEPGMDDSFSYRSLFAFGAVISF